MKKLRISSFPLLLLLSTQYSLLLPALVWAATTTSYLRTDGRAGNTPFTSDIEDSNPTRRIIPRNGRVNGLFCKFDQFRTDGTATFTVRKNRTDTILSCSTDVTISECTVTGSVTVAAGDAISIKMADTSELTAPIVNCSVNYLPQ
jgi:hypothetical protein